MSLPSPHLLYYQIITTTYSHIYSSIFIIQPYKNLFSTLSPTILSTCHMSPPQYPSHIVKFPMSSPYHIWQIIPPPPPRYLLLLFFTPSTTSLRSLKYPPQNTYYNDGSFAPPNQDVHNNIDDFGVFNDPTHTSIKLNY